MSRSILKNFKHQYELYRQQEKCCVCGMKNCNESVDHCKVTLQQIDCLVKDKFPNLNRIIQIKQKVTEIYQEIKLSLFNFLEKDEYQLQTYINKFNFSAHLSKQIDANLISQIMEHNINQLPSKKVGKMVKRLENMSQIQQTDEFQGLKQKSQKLFRNFNINSILSDLKANLPFKNFKEEPRQLKLKPKLSISQITNPEQTDFALDTKVYEWRNIRVTKLSRTVSLSNKNISDRQVMEQVPILSNYKNLREFEIRNNKISCLSCNLIANNMPFLLSVDIRGNNISDKGIIKLIQSIPKMKSFFISETLATDLAGQQVISKMNDLQIFWSQHTKISNEVALKIAQKPKLKVLSFVGNPIDDEFKQKMKKLFISKGYITI